ncbi:MFS transporter, partial [Corynebacterium propinquum]
MNEKANLNPTENAGTESSRAPKTTAGKKAESSGFIYPGLLLPFILIVACFAAWGISTDLTAPMVNVFSSVFDMNAFQSALVQFAYFGAYFLLAIPAAIINTKLGFKGGVVLGMSMAALGAFMFFPASQIMTYGVFLAALFILAGGLSIVETSANPYVMSLGPEKNATRRLNFAQAFNPIGANIGVLMATLLVAPHINDTVDKT